MQQTVIFCIVKYPRNDSDEINEYQLSIPKLKEMSVLSMTQPLILRFGYLDFNFLQELSFVKGNLWFSSDCDFMISAGSLSEFLDQGGFMPIQYHYPIIKLFRKDQDVLIFETEIIFESSDIYKAFKLNSDFDELIVDTSSESWYNLISYDYYRRIFPSNINKYMLLLTRYVPEEYHLSSADPLAIYFSDFMDEE